MYTSSIHAEQILSRKKMAGEINSENPTINQVNKHRVLMLDLKVVKEKIVYCIYNKDIRVGKLNLFIY